MSSKTCVLKMHYGIVYIHSLQDISHISKGWKAARNSYLYCQEFRVRRSMKIFDLDEDILSIVVSYLSISEARELSATARGFHALARQRALSELVLASPTDLTKAHAFMLLDIPNRLRWLRDLRVDIDERFILHHTNHLADLLENAHALQNIHVTSSETWVWSEPRIGDALLHLENLRRIGFSQVGQRVLKVVSSMRSCPVQVDLHGPSGWYRSPVMPTKDSQPADFASLMRSIMPHQRINSLDLSLSHLPLVVRLLDAALQWSTVVHLTISVSFKNAPLPDELVRCFPNLRTLRVHGPEIAVSSPGQRQHFWPKLDYVHGSPIAIGYWNTSCPVYHLSLYTLFAVPAPCSRPHLAAIRDSRAHDAVEGTISVIQQVSPVVLTLNSSLACDFMGLDDHHWTTMLQSAPRLRLLAIDLRRLSGEQFLRWKERVPAVLACSGVVCLLLGIHPYSVDDSHAIPQQLAEAVPSVSYIAIACTSYPLVSDAESHGMFCEDSSWGWWRIIETESRREAQALSPEHGAQLATRFYSPSYHLEERQVDGQ
ncbi:hypothetical protein IEO21_08623 [Rhodonia placenta]|uniref:F-box domain-containing protein n=1 Tax=Rhodonia placenta TaxID=104341 RepID=A0A8H7TZ75_9APHY|nr:hypothetical protein IEO21_08623 [Postia placenta]